MKIISEFKAFISRGNVIDLAVGVIIGGAFSKIISSLVADVIMPLISLLIGKMNISSLAFVIPSGVKDAPPVAIKYGAFLQNIMDFFLISLCIFIFVKIINSIRDGVKKTADEPLEETLKPTETEKLLTEIRDLLKDKEN